MQRVTEQILKHAERLPEGAPIAAKALLNLGERAAVDQALSRLMKRGKLLWAGRGLYVRPIESRFGTRAASMEKIIEAVGLNGAKSLRRTVRQPPTRSGSPHRRQSADTIVRCRPRPYSSTGDNLSRAITSAKQFDICVMLSSNGRCGHILLTHEQGIMATLTCGRDT